jgi:molybdopterin/thiamine biosynthesis adenylyltransferase
MLARWWDDRAGSVVVCIAGIGPLGTQAAGELAVDPHALRKMLAGKSVDFTKRSVQIVFRTNIVDGAIGQSGVVAVHAE